MEPEAVEREAQSAIAAAATPAELDEARVRYLGRKSELKQALRGVRDRETGMKLNALRERLEAAVAARQEELERAELEQAFAQDGLDVTLPGEPVPRGRLHILTQVRREIEDIFLGLGYEIAEGPEIELEYNNFAALNFSDDHPAKAETDTLWIAPGVCLRTHTSPVQARALRAGPPPIYVIVPGRVYRRDTPDATHSPIFHQVEGLVVDRGITLADLKGTLAHFARSLFGADRETRFRTSFFPFTEPSVEVDVSCFLCDGSGCAVCKHSGWVEILGAGEVDPNVLAMADLDTSEWQGFAFGMGIERIAFLKYGFPDLRMLYDNDLRFLEQFPA